MQLLFPVYAWLMRTLIIFQSRMPMIPLTFSIFGAAACTILAYVLVQFRQEFLHIRASSAVKASLNHANSRYRASALKLARSPRLVSGGQQTKDEALMRKEILASAILGALGLLAPFIFVMLLSLSWRR
jgi:hypothetical protein